MSLPRPARLRLVVFPAILLYLAAAVFFVRYGALNPDEGFYAAAARAALAGEMPYRDFGYAQTPLFPYVNGLVLRVTGSGLFEQRAVNGLWGGLALGLAAWWVARRASVAAALLLAVVFALSSPWMYFTHLGKTYAFTGLVAVLASWVWLEWPAGVKKSAALGLLGVVGVGCRLPSVPFFGVLWLASLWDGRRPTWIHLVSACVALVVAFAGLILPFYLAAPEASVFWVLEFHRVSVPLKFWHLAWQEIATLAPALWLATLGAAGIVLVKRGAAGRREVVLAAAALLALAANLLPQGVYEEYGVPFLLPLAMGVTVILNRRIEGGSKILRGTVVTALLAVHLLATPLILWRDFPDRRLGLSQWLTPNAPPLNDALPAQIRHARLVVQALVPSGQPVIGPNLIVALEAGRPIPPNLRMGPFAVGDDRLPLPAAQLHLATTAEIESYLSDPAVPLLVFFKRPALNYGWTMPTYRQLPADLSARWLEIYRRDFVIVDQEGDFLLLARPAALPPGTVIRPQ